MTTTLWLTIGAIALLLVLSAFFSGSETALTAASRARMMQLEKKGNKRAILVDRLISMRERLIGALLFGNNLVNIFASALATSLFLSYFGEAGVAYATLTMTALVLIFAEILPKSWAIANPDRFALAVAPIVRPLVWLFSPITRLIEYFVRGLLSLFGVHLSEQQNILSAHDELRGALDLQHLEGGLVKADRDRLGGLLDLHDMDVSDVMVHRTNMEALNADVDPESLISRVLDSSYTRIPLWQGEPDNIIGVLHAKDLLRRLAAIGWDVTKLKLSEVTATAWFVPEATSLQDQLNAFLRRKSHFALVVDEYGEVMGLVTLEDILEEIVGEISDEHDVVVQGVRPQPDGSILVDGSVSVRDLNRAMDWSLPDDEATTLAGLVLHEAQMIPDERQVFNFYGYRFLVLKKDRNRIAQMRVTPLARGRS